MDEKERREIIRYLKAINDNLSSIAFIMFIGGILGVLLGFCALTH